MVYFRVFLLSLAAVALFYSVRFTSAPAYRYAEYHCQHDAIFNTTGPVDYVMVGGSRSLQGVGAPEFADFVKATTGKDTIAIDLSRSWRGQGVNYVLLRDMVENHRVGTLVVEANLAQTAKYHERFYLMARFKDFMTSYRGQATNGFTSEAAYQLLIMAKDRVMNRISKRINGTLKPAPALSPKRSIETKDCMSREELVNATALSSARKRFQQYYVGKTWQWDPAKKNELHNTIFYKKIVQMAKDNNVKVIFYYVHEAYYKKLDPGFAKEFEEQFGAPLLIPPGDFVEQLEPLYADQTHMTAKGRKLYTDWLANQVLKSNL
jgi:hypothetical protein